MIWHDQTWCFLCVECAFWIRLDWGHLIDQIKTDPRIAKRRAAEATYEAVSAVR